MHWHPWPQVCPLCLHPHCFVLHEFRFHLHPLVSLLAHCSEVHICICPLFVVCQANYVGVCVRWKDVVYGVIWLLAVFPDAAVCFCSICCVLFFSLYLTWDVTGHGLSWSCCNQLLITACRGTWLQLPMLLSMSWWHARHMHTWWVVFALAGRTCVVKCVSLVSPQYFVWK